MNDTLPIRTGNSARDARPSTARRLVGLTVALWIGCGWVAWLIISTRFKEYDSFGAFIKGLAMIPGLLPLVVRAFLITNAPPAAWAAAWGVGFAALEILAWARRIPWLAVVLLAWLALNLLLAAVAIFSPLWEYL